jgi:putative endonuclease
VIEAPALPAETHQQIGAGAEQRAADFLQTAGFEILLRNYRCRTGELDIVARGTGVLVVAEVRLRNSEQFGGAAASITWRKRQRIVRAARHLLGTHREFAALPVRFDVLIVHPDARPVEWLKAAFDA